MKKSNVTFAKVGLDVEHNMLQAPICECGCGERMNLVLNDNSEVCGFIHAMFEEFDCEHCGIFALKKNGFVTMGLKMDGEIVCYKCKVEGFKAHGWKDALKDIQGSLELHCYGIIVQVDDDSYEIVMD